MRPSICISLPPSPMRTLIARKSSRIGSRVRSASTITSASTLRFAKEGLPSARKARVRLSDILRETREAMTPMLGTATLVIVNEADVEIDADAELTQRALENLIRNAVEDYSDLLRKLK